MQDEYFNTLNYDSLGKDLITDEPPYIPPKRRQSFKERLTDALPALSRALQILIHIAWLVFGVVFIAMNVADNHVMFSEYMSLKANFWSFIFYGGLFPTLLFGLAVSGIVQAILFPVNLFYKHPEVTTKICFVLLGALALFLTVCLWIGLYTTDNSIEHSLEIHVGILYTALFLGLTAIMAIPSIRVYKRNDDFEDFDGIQCYITLGLGLLSVVLAGVFSIVMLTVLYWTYKLIALILSTISVILAVLFILFIIGLVAPDK